jgi:hypothetical protein
VNITNASSAAWPTFARFANGRLDARPRGSLFPTVCWRVLVPARSLGIPRAVSRGTSRETAAIRPDGAPYTRPGTRGMPRAVTPARPRNAASSYAGVNICRTRGGVYDLCGRQRCVKTSRQRRDSANHRLPLRLDASAAVHFDDELVAPPWQQQEPHTPADSHRFNGTAAKTMTPAEHSNPARPIHGT